jgi:hypothetical protein
MKEEYTMSSGGTYRSLRDVVKNFFKKKNRHDTIFPTEEPVRSQKFSKDFEGWTIRLHKANGGHIVETWKNEDSYQNAVSSKNKREHEFFLVLEDEDTGDRINDILIQLMLRG